MIPAVPRTIRATVAVVLMLIAVSIGTVADWIYPEGAERFGSQGGDR